MPIEPFVSPEEQTANAAKLAAEAEKALAEAKKALAALNYKWRVFADKSDATAKTYSILAYYLV